MNSKLMKRVIVGILAAAALAAPTFADTIGGATVTTESTGLNLRSEANTASTILAVVPKGAFLLAEEKLDGWYKVSYNGTVGYVSSDYVAFSETLDGTYTYAASTKGTSVNMRTAATTASAVAKNLAAANTSLAVTGVSGDWLRVRDAAGTEGYIRSDLVNYTGAATTYPVQTTVTTTTDPVTSTATNEATVGEQIAATAQQYLGYRYVWGGMSPETGFDCSGFVGYLYKLYGYSLERGTQGIYSNNGVYVSKDELRPGDILCFGYGEYSVGHVGIYIGNGQMVHACNSNTGVILTDISGSWYVNSYVGAKRIIT